MIEQKIEAYDGSSEYSLDNMICLNTYSKMIVEKVEKQNELKVLDLGLGYGYTNRFFEKHFRNYTVLEGDKQIIDMYVKRNPESSATIINTLFEDYETNEKYDIIIMGFVLEHLEDPVFVLRKYGRFLKKGGKIYAAVPNSDALNRRVGYIAGLLDDLKRMSDNDIELGHKRFYDVKSFTDDCEKAGFKVKKVEGIYLKPITTAQIKSLKLTEAILDAFCEVGREYPELCVGILAELQ